MEFEQVVHVLPAAHLRALPQPVLRRVLPVRGDVQARGGRHRPGRPGPLPGLAVLRLRLPVQEGLLQPPHRQGREVHVLLPADRGRAADDLLGDLRGPAALPGPDPLRRRQGARRRGHPRRAGPLRGAAVGVPRPARTPRCRPRPPQQGIPDDWIEAAPAAPRPTQLAVRHRVALPLHPEYRTLPMVWYIPPLSPVADIVHAAGYDDADPDQVFATIDSLRIPVEYLANLFTAGKVEPVRTVLRKLAAVRAIHARRASSACDPNDELAATVGRAARTTWTTCTGCSRSPSTTTATSIPKAHAEDAGRLMGQHEQLFCSLDTEGGPGMGGDRPARHPARPTGPPGHRSSHVPRRRRPRPLQPARLERQGQRPEPVP